LKIVCPPVQAANINKHWESIEDSLEFDSGFMKTFERKKYLKIAKRYGLVWIKKYQSIL